MTAVFEREKKTIAVYNVLDARGQTVMTNSCGVAIAPSPIIIHHLEMTVPGELWLPRHG